MKVNAQTTEPIEPNIGIIQGDYKNRMDSIVWKMNYSIPSGKEESQSRRNLNFHIKR